MHGTPEADDASAPPRRKEAPIAAPAADIGLAIEERRSRVLALLRSEGRVTVEALSRRFGTSAVTIRMDLAALEATGALMRTRGGAVARPEDGDLSIGVKRTLNHAQKVRIARAAAGLIRDGETIILDSGTTTAEIARHIRTLPLESINVITNALNVAMLLTATPSVRLIMPGGILRRESHSLSGHMAENALEHLQADRLFLGVDGLDPEIGLMTPHLAEAQLNARMIQISRQVVAVTDSSKLMRRNVSVIARVEQLHMLITDTGARPDVVAELRGRGVDVRLV
jgi:DeoR family transcriptional regulator of aga operon